MDVHERRQAVKALLAKDPQMGGRSIARLLGVPQTTIRRDLAWLGAGAGAAQFVPQDVSPPVRGGN
jgi:DeoR/GlpR family transcriptional regulator of sugar metabolism